MLTSTRLFPLTKSIRRAALGSLASVMLLAVPSLLVAGTTLSSGERQATLVELYTSEGCSSCPPAESWFNALTETERLWNEIVPVVFHVDYWDYIGWQDRFADKSHAKRQRTYAAELGMRAVYTPGVFKNGEEWRDWRNTQQTQLGAVDKAQGRIEAEIDDDGTVTVAWHTQTPSNDAYRVQIARLGFDLVSEVNAGENNGRTLHHQFVVMGHESKRLKQTKHTEYTATMKLPEANAEAAKQGVAIWVSAVDAQTPLQAVGAWLR